MEKGEILRASATELARAIRERRTSSREVVSAHITRIRAVNPQLNAVVRDRFELALDEADRADAQVQDAAPEALRPFHGVPITVKEAIAVEGMPNSSGLWARRDVVATSDATVVRRLRAAGAIPLGVTNVSELCMWMESANRVWGRTNNPYDARRTPGGSSGGEGAIIGAGGSPLGLGSDVGGSIRMPAFFNGVFGHKPSGGIVPSTGHYPAGLNQVQRYLAAGPLARRAEDLWPALVAVAGPDGLEQGCIEHGLGDPTKVKLEGLRVISVEDHGLYPIERSLRDAQRRVARALAAHGARVEQRRLPKLARSFEIWATLMREGGARAIEGTVASAPETFRSVMAAGQPFRPWVELARAVFGRSRYTMPGLALVLLEELPSHFSWMTEQIVELARELRAELDSLLEGEAVLLHPPHSKVAPRHHDPLLFPLRFVFTGIFNVMELPATEVPLGLDDRGLPLGIQVIGGWGADHVTIAVARELERVFGGWIPPPRLA